MMERSPFQVPEMSGTPYLTPGDVARYKALGEQAVELRTQRAILQDQIVALARSQARDWHNALGKGQQPDLEVITSPHVPVPPRARPPLGFTGKIALMGKGLKGKFSRRSDAMPAVSTMNVWLVRDWREDWETPVTKRVTSRLSATSKRRGVVMDAAGNLWAVGTYADPIRGDQDSRYHVLRPANKDDIIPMEKVMVDPANPGMAAEDHPAFLEWQQALLLLTMRLGQKGKK